jgi:hypothetical protein
MLERKDVTFLVAPPKDASSLNSVFPRIMCGQVDGSNYVDDASRLGKKEKSFL